MSMSDPVGDMLTRIRNALAVGHPTTSCRASRLNSSILQVLADEGYIRGHERSEDGRTIKVMLKYYAGKPVIDSIKRVSRPGLRRYSGFDSVKPVLNGMGIAVVSTSKGVMTDTDARKNRVGGEVICQVY